MKGDRYVQAWQQGQPSEPLYLAAKSLEAWTRAEVESAPQGVTLVGDVPVFSGLDTCVIRRSFVRAVEMIDLGVRKTATTELEPLYVRSADIHLRKADPVATARHLPE
jgi:hypothetical protein